MRRNKSPRWTIPLLTLPPLTGLLGLYWYKEVKPFALGPCIGEGASSKVYICAEDATKVIKVIKGYPFRRKCSTVGTNTCDEEAFVSNVAATNEPSLAPRCYRTRVWWNTSYILMDKVEGRTLFQESSNSANSNNTIVQPSLDIAVSDAIDQLHDLGIEHGDLHYENIMVQQIGKKWQVKFIDFGSSVWRRHPLSQKERSRDRWLVG